MDVHTFSDGSCNCALIVPQPKRAGNDLEPPPLPIDAQAIVFHDRRIARRDAAELTAQIQIVLNFHHLLKQLVLFQINDNFR